MHENLFSRDNIRQALQGAIARTLMILLLTLAFTGCKHAWEKAEKHSVPSDSIRNRFISLADSINYGVVIKAREGADAWQKKWLSKLDRKKWVDFLFDAVYKGRLQPYDYFEDEPMTIEQVKELESKKEFDRSKISKIQFQEKWYFNPENLQMVKEVYSVMLAYEVYKDDGSFRGYKPAFKIILNQSIGGNKSSH